MRLDAVIFGGDATGLWLLDRLSRDGLHVVLLEPDELGAGMTMGSLGFLSVQTHNGDSNVRLSREVRELPGIWRNALLGRIAPNLTRTRLRSECSSVWNLEEDLTTSNSGSRRQRDRNDLPNSNKVLASQQVLCPRSFVEDLAEQYRDRILKIDLHKKSTTFHVRSPGEVERIELNSTVTGQKLILEPRQVIFTAGSQNSRLRKMVGLSDVDSERQVDRVFLIRGSLPTLFGAIHTSKERFAEIVTAKDDRDRAIWLISFRQSIDGMKASEELVIQLVENIEHATGSSIPFSSNWACYDIEAFGTRDDRETHREPFEVLCAGNVTTGLTSSIVIAPRVAQEIADRATSPYISSSFETSSLSQWPRPSIAKFPWDDPKLIWTTLPERPTGKTVRRRAA